MAPDRTAASTTSSSPRTAPQVKRNPIERGWCHTDWVADRTIAWLDGLDADDDWFCWMSFPDPHHPWDPPASELHRVDWRDVDLPVGHPTTAAEEVALLDTKPRQWRLWYDGELVPDHEAPARWVPATLTADQVREVNALTAIAVGLVDLASTFATIAGVGPQEWMQGAALPVDDSDASDRWIDAQLTSWDSELNGIDVHLRTITRDGWTCTAHLPGTMHDGTEGELHSLVDDPLQHVNRWDDPAVRSLRDDLLSDLWDRQPPGHEPRLQLQAPV